VNKYIFDDVTLLITHYNRSKSLERLLKAFLDLNCHFEKIIVSDDSSTEFHKNYILSISDKYTFDFITSDVNRGLGNNINKGQVAVKTKFTLYVQEDFVPQQCFPEVFINSLEIMRERSDIDIIRYYAYFLYPHLKPFMHGFSEMNFKIWNWGYKKFYVYSDHPHLRRSDFCEKFGNSVEGKNVEFTEYKMVFSFLKKKGKGLFFNEFKNVFDQMNTSEEPSTFKRSKLRESNNFFIYLLRETYRHVKFNFDYFF
jgi:glycosyltransferase involved in cell wall biosynthesis